MTKQPIEILADIIQWEMGLSDSDVIISNSGVHVPNNKGILIVISLAPVKVISSISLFDHSLNKEKKEASILQFFDINILSADSTAQDRKEEVLLSITSFSALKKGEEEGFRLVRFGDILDLSEIEGDRSLNRYKTSCGMYFKKVIIKDTEVFDKFITSEVIVK